MKVFWFAIIFICFAITELSSQTNQSSTDSSRKDESKTWFIKKLNIPKKNNAPHVPVKVAIIDDGFRITHKVLEKFIYRNIKEIPNNYRDDDGNGYIDDYIGWDLSDKDKDVAVPKSREEDFYHGTYIAGIIITLFKEYYGDDADKYLQIIPIKAVSDNSKNMLVTDGYEGIRYADKIGADIICCAWSGGEISNDDIESIKKVIEKERLIVASAGNFFCEDIKPPASLNGTICVGATDEAGSKFEKSNYGIRLDISAPGKDIYNAHPIADNAFFFESGTSPAAAIISGCMAILKSISGNSSSKELLEALKNTAEPLDSANRTYAGKLGAGIPNITDAIKYLTDNKYKYTSFNPSLSQGKINYKATLSKPILEIHPAGDYIGIHLIPSEKKKGTKLKIANKDSIYFNDDIGQIQSSLFINGNYASLEVINPKTAKDFSFEYYVQTFDSTTLYCKDITYINQSEGEIEDGSGIYNYANNCSCKWLIKVPDKMRMRIEFTEMDTEANVDYVWIFEGNSTIPEYLLAKFSGQNKPPIITTLTNETLIWFVADKKKNGKGWKFKFSAID
jgi:hypothetical protein